MNQNFIKFAQFSVTSVGKEFFFVIFESPYFCDEEAGEETAKRHQYITVQTIEPVEESIHGNIPAQIKGSTGLLIKLL